MKTIFSTMGYRQNLYIHGARYIIPFFVLILFLGGAYSYMPVQVVNSFTFTESILFFVMIIIGFTYGDVEDPVSEQLLILKMGKAWKHYMAQTLFLLLIGVAFSLITVAFPLVVNALYKFALFKRPVTGADAVCALILHCGAAYMGGAVGAIFHPRILQDRKLSMLLCLFVAVVGFTKTGIHQHVPFAAAVTWVFPPIADLVDMFTGQETFTAGKTAYAAGMMMLYGTALSAIKMAVLLKKKF